MNGKENFGACYTLARGMPFDALMIVEFLKIKFP